MGSTPTAIGSGQNSAYSQFADPSYNPNPTGSSGGSFGYMTLAGMGNQQAYNAGVQNSYALGLGRYLAPELAGYTSFLNNMTSADPMTRLATVAPQAEAVSQQQAQARQNIKNLPRGGAQDYLLGQSYIQQSSDIGNLINNAWLQAQQQRGQLGEFGVQATEAGLALANSALSGAASTTNAAVAAKQGKQAANQQTATSAAETIAMMLAMA